MRTRIAGAVLALSALLGSARAEFESFLPENDMRIPVRAAGDNKGITKEQFDQVLDAVEKIYGPIIAARGARLQVERNWDDDTVNAYAYRSDGAYVIAMFGGLARHETVTQDGFALVACHELGHHIGGGPKIGGYHWATNEGQSDYFANLKCLRRVYASAAAASFTRPLAEGPAVQACARAYAKPDEQAFCVRSSMAGLSLGTLLATLGGEGVPRFETPDPAVVAETNDRHPKGQCRLDTYFQGALCAQPVSAEVDDNDHHAGTCTRKNGSLTGIRPRCWYKPPADEPAGVAKAPRTQAVDLAALREAWEGL